MSNITERAKEQLEWIRSRRSTRRFQDRPVEREKLEMIVEAGRYAPSGGNSQSTHFIVIEDRKVLEKLEALVQKEFQEMEEKEGMYHSLVNSIRRSKTGNYAYSYQAPVLIITAGKKGYANNLADASCAVENMMLEANALDLGSVWINQLHWLTDHENVIKFLRNLGLGEDETVCASVAIGYADTEDALPDRRPLARHGNPVTWILGFTEN